ncbi:MAG: asparaginase domain-containing protein [Gammaproteobacteria bacterium]
MDFSDLEILCCGGTIDKVYFDAESSHQVGAPAAAEIFRRARAAAPPIVSLMKKDSLDMTEDDRAAVVAAIRNSAARRILVCHGTDTMARTARAAGAADTGKTAVFVGAFLPAVFRDSDADFNLGFALAAAQTLPPGAYIAMNGRIFPAETARKNTQAGRFETAE